MSDDTDYCPCGRPSCQPDEPATPAERRAAANEQIADAVRAIADGRDYDDRVWNWELVDLIDEADRRP